MKREREKGKRKKLEKKIKKKTKEKYNLPGLHQPDMPFRAVRKLTIKNQAPASWPVEKIE
jgi:hypothetical protein